MAAILPQNPPPEPPAYIQWHPIVVDGRPRWALTWAFASLRPGHTVTQRMLKVRIWDDPDLDFTRTYDLSVNYPMVGQEGPRGEMLGFQPGDTIRVKQVDLGTPGKVRASDPRETNLVVPGVPTVTREDG